MRRAAVLIGVLAALVLSSCASGAATPVAPQFDSLGQVGLGEAGEIPPQEPPPQPTPVPEAPPAVGGAPDAGPPLEAGAEGPVERTEVQTQPLGRFIINQAQMTIQVEDPEFSLIQIENLAFGMGGFISNSQISRVDGQLRGIISIRVPAGSFNEARQRIRDLAQEVVSDNVSGQDVTEEFTDLESRLRHLEATEVELLELLIIVREQTESAAEVLAIFNELTKIREQIEQVKGRMNYLDNLVTFATITVQIMPPPEPQEVEFAGEVESAEEDSFVVNGTTVVLEPDAEVTGNIEEGVTVDVRGIRQRDGTISASRVQVAEVLEGEVEFAQGSTLIVNGTTVLLGVRTEVIGTLHEGTIVEVRGLRERFGTIAALRVRLAEALEGEVQSVGDHAVIVKGNTVLLGPQAEVLGEIEEGALVEVRGFRQRDGTFSALRVRVAEFLEGEVESIERSTLVVKGTTVHLSQGTEVIGKIEEGSQVELHGFPEDDGSLTALRVEVTRPAPPYNPGRTVRHASERLGLALQAIADLAIWVLLFAVPTLLLLGAPVAAVLGGWRWYRRRWPGAEAPERGEDPPGV